jgi:propanol-preferring alcohol dehydrogenase
MRAMVLEKVGHPLVLRNIPCPTPNPYEVLVKVKTCGVCRTDLHIVDGELPHPKLPLILGHQVVSIVDKLGENASKHKIGDQVGIPWLGGSCYVCEFCISGRENLCDKAMYTGYLRDGGRRF